MTQKISMTTNNAYIITDTIHRFFIESFLLTKDTVRNITPRSNIFAPIKAAILYVLAVAPVPISYMLSIFFPLKD